MNEKKNQGLEQILKNADKGAIDYQPKHKTGTRTKNKVNRHKSKPTKSALKVNRVSKDKKNIFKPKTSSKQRQYGVLRVRRPVVNSLKALQMITGDKSRSQLLSQMIEYCKPAILSDDKKKKRYQDKMNFLEK